jgi:hypothetical protein
LVERLFRNQEDEGSNPSGSTLGLRLLVEEARRTGSIPADSIMDKEDVKDKANEKLVLSRKELLALRVAAATGVMSFISHGIAAVTWLASHWPL